MTMPSELPEALAEGDDGTHHAQEQHTQHEFSPWRMTARPTAAQSKPRL
jgi:hypothetical protein